MRFLSDFEFYKKNKSYCITCIPLSSLSTTDLVSNCRAFVRSVQKNMYTKIGKKYIRLELFICYKEQLTIALVFQLGQKKKKKRYPHKTE